MPNIPSTPEKPISVTLAPERSIEPRMIYCWLNGLRIKVHKTDYSAMALLWKNQLSLTPPKIKTQVDDDEIRSEVRVSSRRKELGNCDETDDTESEMSSVRRRHQRVEDQKAMIGANGHGDHHDQYLDNGESPMRPSELRAPVASTDIWAIAWDLQQFTSDLSSITKEMELSNFVAMALVIVKGHTFAPEAKKK
jgi:hypothetical protein